MNDKITLTLFHASYCGHCHDFYPTWEQMKNNKKTDKYFEFRSYESEEIDGLSDKIKLVGGKPIRGFPTIKIKIANKEWDYDGKRTSSKIFEFILNQLKNL